MLIYRLSQKRWVSDLSGEGARLNGGRWNLRGTPMLYTGSSRALTVLEYLVHFKIKPSSVPLAFAVFEVPDDLAVETLTFDKLPKSWRDFPHSTEVSKIGQSWVETSQTAVLAVPSVLIPQEFNFLLNPSHQDFSAIILKATEDYAYDPRLVSIEEYRAPT